MSIVRLTWFNQSDDFYQSFAFDVIRYMTSNNCDDIVWVWKEKNPHRVIQFILHLPKMNLKTS